MESFCSFGVRGVGHFCFSEKCELNIVILGPCELAHESLAFTYTVVMFYVQRRILNRLTILFVVLMSFYNFNIALAFIMN